MFISYHAGSSQAPSARKSESRCPGNFSNAAAASTTETVFPVSLSIDVIITFEIPQGVIWPNGERSPHTFNANPCIVIQ